MPEAVRNWPRRATGPKEDPLIEAFNEILKSKAVWQSYVPLMQGLLVAEDNRSTFHYDSDRATAWSAKEI
jgi:hypothetical protein